MEKNIKRYYYVAIVKYGNFYFVTSVPEDNKVTWERGKNPYNFNTLSDATKVSDGLIKSGHVSVVVQSLAEFDFQRKE